MTNHYKTIRWHKEGYVHYSFPACLAWLEHAGKKRYGENFKILTEDHAILLKLLTYAIGDEEGMRKASMHPRKGLLLVGPVGCGKTSLMQLLNNFFPLEKRYTIQSSRGITMSFLHHGFQTIAKYTQSSYQFYASGYRPRVYCFDDIGLERPVRYYGNECNVMAEILLSRYDHFINREMLTHLTTNLSATELENIYGNRLRSRMREMFNLVSFKRDAKDKRQ